MKNSFYILAFLVVAVAFVVGAQAQEDDPFADITYPITELGNCTDKENCLDFCDNPDNMGACLDFAEENNLMPEEDIEIGKKMLSAGETAGPGGCRGVTECGDYCDDMSNLKECVAFAEKHDLMSADELNEAKKVSAALDRGVQPPPCNSKSECDDICSQPENMKTCITFAKEAGLMTPEDLGEAEKVLAAIEKGVIPPPCGGKDECDEYCALPENLETCITFAEAAGFMSAEEATMVRKTGGKGPGDCRGREACDTYCEDPDHGEECISFALENGFMSAEDAEQAKKMLAAGINMMAGGPGGCKGKEECEAFCDDVSNMNECVDFAERAGMMSPEDAARARKMAEMGINMMGGGGPGECKGEEECRSFCDDPANMEECMNFAVQIGDMTPEEAEEARQGMQMMAQMKECLVMPCSEALPCFENLSQGGEMERGEPTEEDGGGEGAEIQAKIESCIQEQMPEGMIPQEGMMRPEDFEFEGEIPEGFQEQFREQIPEGMEEEIQRQIEQQIQQQIQQQMQQQIEQQMMNEPQSLFDRIKNFLAGLVPGI